MLHPGWVSGLKVKACCEGPDPPSIGISHLWSVDQQGVVQTESVCSGPMLTSSRESCQQK